MSTQQQSLKFINQPENVASETLEGYLAANSRDLQRIDEFLAIRRREVADKVAIVSGGGSGHEPVWLEYLGEGFADAVVQGDIFAAPDPVSITAAVEAVDCGRGALLIYGNFSGDRLNFDLAAELLEADGRQIATVRVADDVAAAGPDRAVDRRGIAGGFFVAKIGGAAAAAGLSLEQVRAAAQAAADRTRSMGVASRGGTIPGTTTPTFTLPEGSIEIGMGMHGEAGVRRGPMEPADTIVDQMLDLILDDRTPAAKDRLAVLINGLGATTRAELFIVARRVAQYLAGRGLDVHDLLVGNYATSQEMHGFSISVAALDDDLIRWYDAPGRTTFYAGRTV